MGKRMGFFERVWSKLPDLHDLFFVVGMFGLFYGLHGYDPRVAWIVTSSISILLGLGILTPHRKAKPAPPGDGP